MDIVSEKVAKWVKPAAIAEVLLLLAGCEYQPLTAQVFRHTGVQDKDK